MIAEKCFETLEKIVACGFFYSAMPNFLQPEELKVLKNQKETLYA